MSVNSSDSVQYCNTTINSIVSLTTGWQCWVAPKSSFLSDYTRLSIYTACITFPYLCTAASKIYQVIINIYIWNRFDWQGLILIKEGEWFTPCSTFVRCVSLKPIGNFGGCCVGLDGLSTILSVTYLYLILSIYIHLKAILYRTAYLPDTYLTNRIYIQT